jgi:hypothetical protein
VFEAVIASALLMYLILLAVLGIAWEFTAGAMLALIGLVGGGAAGIVYHLALRRALVRLGASKRGWLWSPVSCHRLLDELGRNEVLPWFRLGAAGFFVCLAGIGMIAVAIVKAAFAR